MAKVGDRIRVTQLDDPYTSIGPGSEGEITDVNRVNMGRDSFTQYSVKWDQGGSLMLCTPPDRFVVIVAAED